MPRFRRLTALALLASLLPLPMAEAAPPQAKGVAPTVSAQRIRDFTRIQFEWPYPVPLSAHMQGNVLIIAFDRRVAPQTGPMLAALRPHAKRAEISSGGRELRLVMDRAYRVRSFVSGDVSGVDILDASPLVASRQPEAEELAVAATEGSEYAALSPAAGAAETRKSQPERKRAAIPKKEKPKKVPPPAKAAVKAAATTATANASPAAEMPGPPAYESDEPVAPPGWGNPPPAPLEKSYDSDTAEGRLREAKAEKETREASAGPFAPKVTTDGATIDMRFPWKERVGAAAFIHARKAWIVFGKSAAVDLTAIRRELNPREGSVQQLSAPGATVLLLPLDHHSGLSLQTGEGEDSTYWRVTLHPDRKTAAAPVTVQANADAAQPYVFVAALEAQEPITATDPDTGDELVIAPFHQSGQGVTLGRTFVDFEVLESAQGLAVKKISDAAQVMLARNGIRISAGQGTPLSAGLPPPEELAPPANPEETLFPYKAWKPAQDKADAQRVEIQTLVQDVIKASTTREANEKRLRLAQIYLAQGYAVEALGWLGEIRRNDPAFYAARRLSAMSGAANFLLYRFKEAAQDFSVKELDGLPEIAFWRNVVAELLGTPEQDFDYAANKDRYLAQYPTLLRQRLAILAADRAVAAKQYNAALAIFDELVQAGISEDIADYINYLTATISVETGKPKEGVLIWESIAQQPRSSFVRARAEYSLIAEGLRSGTMTHEEAISRLRGLTLLWRGDNLELSALKLLGDLYAERGDLPSAMRVWRDMTKAFPGTAPATEAGRRMSDAFIQLFAKDDGSGLPTIEELFLFNEFRDLTPTDSVGDKIIDRMTDRMVSLDLLDQAAATLEQRMRLKFEREQRSVTGAKLARVYLLNRQPELARRTLEDSAYGNNPESVRIARNYLTARTLVALKEYEAGLALLKDDTSPEADAIRLQAYWQQKDWGNVIANAEALLKKRKDPAAMLGETETQAVLQLALAYAAERDTAQMGYLRDYFLPLTPGGPRKSLLEFITRPDAPLTAENFTTIMQSLDDARQVLSQIEAKGL